MAASRIIYFSRDYTPHDFRFLSVLAESPYEAAYLRLENNGQSLEKRPLPAEVIEIPWDGGKGLVNWRRGMELLPALRRIIRTYRPHLIHAGPIQRPALMAALVGFHPLVSMSWGYDLIADARKNTVWKLATHYTLKNSDWLIADCQAVRKLAVQYGMDSDRVTVFPWGVDLGTFSPLPAGVRKSDQSLRVSLGWGEDKFVLLSARTWATLYGIEELAFAFVKAFQRCPSLRLLMLGTGPLASRIQDIFKKGLGELTEKVVYFAGQVPEEKLAAYFQAADLYVSASHSDGSSITLLQALACGCPALVSDIPGNQEWVMPNTNGWWFRMGDADDLCEAILYACRMSAALPQMGKAARQLAEQYADWKQHAQQLLNVYEHVLHGQ